MKKSLVYLLLLGFISVAHGETPQPSHTTEPQQSEALPSIDSNQALLAEYKKTIKKMRDNMRLPDGVLPDPEAAPDSKAEGAEQTSELQLRVITGNEGIAFPSPEQVVFEPTPTPEVWPSETPAPTPTPWQRPGRCDKSTSVKVGVPPKGADSNILSDKLFLPEDFVPIDDAEVYGAGVFLYPYGPNQGEGQHLVQEMYVVPCLPFRIRQTPWGYFEHRGDDALKRYGSSGMSSATFHPWVEQKLYGTTKKSPRRGK